MTLTLSFAISTALRNAVLQKCNWRYICD